MSITKCFPGVVDLLGSGVEVPTEVLIVMFFYSLTHRGMMTRKWKFLGRGRFAESRILSKSSLIRSRPCAALTSSPLSQEVSSSPILRPPVHSPRKSGGSVLAAAKVMPPKNVGKLDETYAVISFSSRRWFLRLLADILLALR